MLLTTVFCSKSDFDTVGAVNTYGSKTMTWFSWYGKPSSLSRSKHIVHHPNYLTQPLTQLDSSWTVRNDIAMVKFESYLFVSAPGIHYNIHYDDENVLDAHTKCIVTGWGNSTHMQKASVSFIPNEECRFRIPNPGGLTK